MNNVRDTELKRGKKKKKDADVKQTALMGPFELSLFLLKLKTETENTVTK